MNANELREAHLQQQNKFNLVVCELFNRYIHGYYNNSDKSVNGHYLCVHISKNRSIFDNRDYNSDDESDNENENENDNELFLYLNAEEAHIYDIVDLYSAYYISYGQKIQKPHKTIRNYDYIVSRDTYIQPHIGEVIYLPSGECITIIKTIWIKIVQRCWRKVFNMKKYVIKRRMQLESLKLREVHGKWPNDCNYLPSIYGMFWR
jgi:hypothetical protein